MLIFWYPNCIIYQIKNWKLEVCHEFSQFDQLQYVLVNMHHLQNTHLLFWWVLKYSSADCRSAMAGQLISWPSYATTHHAQPISVWNKQYNKVTAKKYDVVSSLINKTEYNHWIFLSMQNLLKAHSYIMLSFISCRMQSYEHMTSVVTLCFWQAGRRKST